jgi:hypothetical protein
MQRDFITSRTVCVHVEIIGNKSIHEKNKAMALMNEHAPTMNSLTIQLCKLELQSPLIAQSKRQPRR